jgi:hypothetical protein
MQDVAPRRYHSEYKRYLFTYLYAGTEWSVEIAALSLDEAKERMKVIPFARYEGESAPRRAAAPEPAARRGGWLRLFGDAA